MEDALLQATIYLGAAVLAVPLATRLGLGSVLGYLLAGIAIGPALGLIAGDIEGLRHVAEFGVVMMLFLVGLELDPRALWDMRRKLIGLGGLQIALTTAALAWIGTLIGLPLATATAAGLVLALSSTAIVLQTLDEKGLMRTSGGRSIFSVLLSQDIAVIPILAVLPLLAISFLRPDVHAEDAHHGMSLVEGLPAWGVTLVTLGAVGAVILAGVYLVGPAFRFIDRARLREMYVAFALLIVVGIATLMNLVGLSPALGTFLAGVVLANSEFKHELESDIEPFKGLLLGLFFITVGAGIDFDLIAAEPARIAAMAVGLMAVKAAVLLPLALVFGLRGRDAALFTLALAQAGEFGFVLTAFAVQQSVLPTALADTLMVVVALSMLLTPLFFIAYEAIARRLEAASPEDEADAMDEAAPVIIAGIGRFGQIVNRLAQGSGFEVTVLDSSMETVRLMRRFGFRGFFGDPSRPDVLASAGLATARVLVIALDDRDAALRLARYARAQRPDLHIVARARDRVHVYELFAAGADDIVRETFDSSLRAGRYVLEAMGLTDYEAAEAERAFYAHDRRALRELAELWRPGVPVSQNAPYMERVHALNAELEAALVATLDEGDDGDARADTRRGRARAES